MKKEVYNSINWKFVTAIVFLILSIPVFILILIKDNSIGIGVPVFDYHSIDDSPYTAYTIDVDNFAMQMNILNSSGFKTITFDQWYNYSIGKSEIPKKSVILIFDDGYESVIANATPIMDRYGYVGVVDLITYRIPQGKSGYYMNWTDVKSLLFRGWQIASHSKTHINMLYLPGDERRAEFIDSKNSIIDNLGMTPTLFVYPYNANNDTLDSECALYYDMCSGYAQENMSFLHIEKNFLFKSSNPVKGGVNSEQMGLSRIVIRKNITIQQFINIVNLADNPLSS